MATTFFRQTLTTRLTQKPNETYEIKYNVSLTSFFGGKDRGRSLSLHIRGGRKIEQFAQIDFTREQVKGIT